MTHQRAAVSEQRRGERQRCLLSLLLAAVAIVAVPPAVVVSAPTHQVDDRATDRRQLAAAAPTSDERGSSVDVFWEPPVPLVLAAPEQARSEALAADAAVTLSGVLPFQLGPRPPPLHALS